MVNLDELEEKVIPRFKGGEKEMRSAAFADDLNRIMRNTLAPGASIGMHRHETNSEIIYVLQGTGKAVIDGSEERLATGLVHYCRKGHEHTIINDGPCDLVFLALLVGQ